MRVLLYVLLFACMSLHVPPFLFVVLQLKRGKISRDAFEVMVGEKKEAGGTTTAAESEDEGDSDMESEMGNDMEQKEQPHESDAYKEHQCSFIFVFNQLPFASVAKGMGLLFVSHSIHVV